MSLLKEFKTFASRGNVIDMAVGIIIGASFGKIVSSFVGDIIMPPIGIVLGGVNFSDLSIVLQAAQGETEAVFIAYGKFIQTIIDFTIIAFSLFIGLKFINNFKRNEAPQEEPPSSQSKEEDLLSEIRDLLKSKLN